MKRENLTRHKGNILIKYKCRKVDTQSVSTFFPFFLFYVTFLVFVYYIRKKSVIFAKTIKNKRRMEKRFTPDFIRELAPNEVFVFGSNLSGAHGGGAALVALRKFGAVWGQGVGLQGQSYGIPTMHVTSKFRSWAMVLATPFIWVNAIARCSAATRRYGKKPIHRRSMPRHATRSAWSAPMPVRNWAIAVRERSSSFMKTANSISLK